MLLNLKFISAKNTSKSDLKTNHTRVMYTYSLLHQRRIFRGNSSIHILPPPPWLSSLNEESFLPDKFRDMTKQSNRALRTPVVILSDTLFWLRTVFFVREGSLNIFPRSTRLWTPIHEDNSEIHCLWAFGCDLLDFCCERKKGNLLLRLFGRKRLRLFFIYVLPVSL